MTLQAYVLRYTLPEARYMGVSSTAEVADWMGISPRRFREWRNKGKGPKYDKWGSKFQYKMEYISDYVDKLIYFLEGGDDSGLIPYEGTGLEVIVTHWWKQSGKLAEMPHPQSPNRDSSALIVDNFETRIIIPADYYSRSNSAI